MAKTTTARKPKTQPKPLLTHDELKRIAEKLSTALNNYDEEIGLLTMLFDHIETVSQDAGEPWSSIYTIKKHLFINTSPADAAQERFQSNAYANRGTLLMWPSERKGAK